MKKQQQLALIAAGQVSGSSLSRQKRLLGRLGPVKSNSLRIASRIANKLQAGFPVTAFEQLAPYETIVISWPAGNIEKLVRDVLQSGLKLEGRTMVLLSVTQGSEVLGEFRARGASVASISESPFARYLALEGDRRAVKFARGMFETREKQFLEIGEGQKQEFLAATLLSEFLLFQLTEMYAESLDRICAEDGAGRRFAIELIARFAEAMKHKNMAKAGAEAATNTLEAADYLPVALRGQYRAMFEAGRAQNSKAAVP